MLETTDETSGVVASERTQEASKILNPICQKYIMINQQSARKIWIVW